MGGATARGGRGRGGDAKADEPAEARAGEERRRGVGGEEEGLHHWNLGVARGERGEEVLG